MAAPLAIQLSARRPQTLVGEQILFDLGVRVAAPLTMEPPELNRSRTTLLLQTKDAAAPRSWTLNGADHMRIFHVHPLSEVGSAFEVEAGRQWKATLNLLQFTLPLPTGKYEIALRYRYGNNAADSVTTNTAAFEVLPAGLGSISYRWYGGAKPAETLGSVFVALDNGNEEWFYQIGSRRNPGAVETSVRIGRAARHAGARPVLAQLNDVQAMHFLKYVLWEQDGEIGALPVHSEGRGGEPRFVKHGLQPGAALVDPPLQRHHGGLMAMLTGKLPDGRPGWALVTLPENGQGESRVAALDAAPVQALALWPADERAPSLYMHAGGRWLLRKPTGETGPVDAEHSLESLALFQWMGAGTVYGHYRDAKSIHTYARGTQGGASTPAHSYDAAGIGKFVASAWREPGGVALLMEKESGGWVVLDGGQQYPIPAARRAAAAPVLLPAGKAIYVLQHDLKRGFLALMVGTPPPEALI